MSDTTAKDNIQAFPSTVRNWNDSLDNGPFCAQPGMSLRDWFAGQALSAKVTNGAWANSDGPVIARWAYAIADAMLSARSKGDGK